MRVRSCHFIFSFLFFFFFLTIQMMHLFTMTFELDVEDQPEFIQAVNNLQSYCTDLGIEVKLFRDRNRQTRLHQMFITEKSVDDVTRLVQEESPAKEVFRRIKEANNRVVISVMDKLV